MANEKRLIDANALIDKFWQEECRTQTRRDFVAMVNYAPTVDAVEVVRCKDCKKGHPELAPNGGVWCALWNHVFHDDCFCSKGERKDNERKAD
jgi:hypothetical protein